jgi:type II secretory pathway pseudopilin PulG
VVRRVLCRQRARGRQAGFTYLWVLVAVALIGIGLAATGEVWTTSARRAKIEQADWAGLQYLQAIGSYYESAPLGANVYPDTLEALLADGRGPITRRHLRALYRNPFSEDGRWEPVRAADGRISGVRLVLPEAMEPRQRLYVYARQRDAARITAFWSSAQ